MSFLTGKLGRITQFCQLLLFRAVFILEIEDKAWLVIHKIKRLLSREEVKSLFMLALRLLIKRREDIVSWLG